MRIFLLAILVLFASVGLGLWIYQDPGYLLIAHRKTTLEMPLWLGILLILLLFLLLGLLLRTTGFLLTLPSQFHHWWAEHQLHKAVSMVNEGCSLIGRKSWPQLERYARSKNRKFYKMLILPKLLAALSAYQQKNYQEANSYLNQISVTFPEAQESVLFLGTLIALRENHYGQAKKLLERWLVLQPKNAIAWGMKAKFALLFNDKSAIDSVLEKQKFLSLDAKQKNQLLKTLFLKKIESFDFSEEASFSNVASCWAIVPHALRYDGDLAYLIAKALIRSLRKELALALIAKQLKHEWNSELVLLYGSVYSETPQKQLQQAERWLSTHSDDAELMFSLARLCVVQQVWGKARYYYERSLALKKNPRTYWYFAELLQSLDEKQAASLCYQEGLKLTLETLSDRGV